MANEMKTTIEGIHYVAVITIEEVSSLKHEPVYRGQGATETRERKTNELGKVVLKDKLIANLIEKAKKSLDIIAE